MAESRLPRKVRSLRTKELRPYGERRQAALFCYGMSCVLGVPVVFAHVEKADYDCVARWVIGHSAHFRAVQLKELVPPDINPKAALESELSKLTKYQDSDDLTVAFYINRPIRLENRPQLPAGLRVGEVWAYGASSSDSSKWMICGDLLQNPTMYEYAYPS